MVQEHFKEIASEIRSDLDGNFERIRKESTEALVKKFGDQGHTVANSFVQAFEELNDFIRGQLLGAVLDAISKHGEPEDVRFGRTFLFNSDIAIQRSAIRILSKHGNTTDAESLSKLALQSSGDIKADAAVAALKLNSGVNGIATDFLKTEDPVLVALALKGMDPLPEEEALKGVEFLLSGEKTETRVKAIAYCAKSCSSTLLEKFLEKYLQKDSYYYNVVCWLDRVLYSPLPGLKEFYLRRLAEELERD